jgi:hypothetical protein
MANITWVPDPTSSAAATSLDTHEHPAPDLSAPPDPSGMYRYRDSVAAALATVAPLLGDSGKSRGLRRACALRDCGRAGIAIECCVCGAPHIVPYRCGARTCPACSRRHAARIAERTARRAAVHDLIMENEPWDGHTVYPQRRSWRHLTLTTPAPHDLETRFDPRVLKATVRRVRAAVSRFWRRSPYGAQKRDQLTGRKRSRRDTSYIVGIEVAPGGMVHAHMLIYGEFVSQARLERAWSLAFGQPAFVFVRSLRGSNGIESAIKEALKYATKGEADERTQAAHAAAVELAFWNVKRLSIGGAMRGIHAGDQKPDGDDGRPEDLHARKQLACMACGAIGLWKWRGALAPSAVLGRGGYGLVTAIEVQLGVQPHCPGGADRLNTADAYAGSLP